MASHLVYRGEIKGKANLQFGPGSQLEDYWAWHVKVMYLNQRMLPPILVGIRMVRGFPLFKTLIQITEGYLFLFYLYSASRKFKRTHLKSFNCLI